MFISGYFYGEQMFISGYCYGEQSGTVASSLQVLKFRLPLFMPQTAPYSLITMSLTLQSLNIHSVIK
jgi:hypothetical protein